MHWHAFAHEASGGRDWGDGGETEPSKYDQSLCTRFASQRKLSPKLPFSDRMVIAVFQCNTLAWGWLLVHEPRHVKRWYLSRRLQWDGGSPLPFSRWSFLCVFHCTAQLPQLNLIANLPLAKPCLSLLLFCGWCVSDLHYYWEPGLRGMGLFGNCNLISPFFVSMISGGAYAHLHLLMPSLIAEAVPSRCTTWAIANRSHLLLLALDGGILKTPCIHATDTKCRPPETQVGGWWAESHNEWANLGARWGYSPGILPEIFGNSRG